MAAYKKELVRNRKNGKFFADLYQLAGELLLAPDTLSDGQKARLTETLLDALSQPNHFSAYSIRAKRALAVME